MLSTLITLYNLKILRHKIKQFSLPIRILLYEVITNENDKMGSAILFNIPGMLKITQT